MEEPIVDRVTRQRNIQLQKQLGVKLQIINEEYRMVKQDQDKNSRELSDFITCLRHTAPGLSSYGQPDTRTMTIRHSAVNRKSVHWETDGSVDKMYLQTARKSPCLNAINRFGDASPPSNHVTTYVLNPSTNPRPRSEPSARNSFFNKRIVLDSRRHSFIANAMRNANCVEVAGNMGSPKTAKHSDTQSFKGELTTNVPVQSYRRSSLPRYGRDAYSAQEQKDRNNLLKKFDNIFESYSSNVRTKVGSVMALERILSVQHYESKCVENDSKTNTSEVVNISSKSLAKKSLLQNRRVVWSAPMKHNADAISVVTCPNSVVTSQAEHKKLSRSPVADSATSSQARKSVHRPSSTMPSKCYQDDQNHDLRLFSRGFPYTNRPKTAPPSYELKQRGVAAPRQQVAGILADIQSRRADTRAILSKSRQLHHAVRTLTPQIPQDDDSD